MGGDRLHTSDGIAERRGVLAYLTRRGIGVDIGFGTEFVTDAQGEALHSRYPRLDVATRPGRRRRAAGRPLPAGRPVGTGHSRRAAAHRIHCRGGGGRAARTPTRSGLRGPT
ncbi:hypothetical protein Snoj_16760 [Streptomyces nojiriensis]|uniref:Uncharacterized protein n=1 Tax=Streptomyces nojiriensis TaxID=66374 RepID=A0ABQ3SHZ3_9ACTN|nr:hypothetical protein [Streptomyces nojiriensis]GGS36678.1 hypothetical protein GCM10010205_78430 [Streptomyces nojiriensis]GHI67758.1 hypothetical protein Snoj_16760 [Streptomyces nojiriensis]